MSSCYPDDLLRQVLDNKYQDYVAGTYLMTPHVDRVLKKLTHDFNSGVRCDYFEKAKSMLIAEIELAIRNNPFINERKGVLKKCLGIHELYKSEEGRRTTAFVLGAGYTLAENINLLADFLKQMDKQGFRHQFKVIVQPRTLRFAFEAGIEPDYLMIIDPMVAYGHAGPSNKTFGFLYDYPLRSKTSAILMSQVDREYFKLSFDTLKRTYTYHNAVDGFLAPLQKKHGHGAMPSGGSVSVDSIIFSQFMRCKNIVILGVDNGNPPKYCTGESCPSVSLGAYKEFDDFCKKMGMKNLYNCGNGTFAQKESLQDILNRIYTEDVSAEFERKKLNGEYDGQCIG